MIILLSRLSDKAFIESTVWLAHTPQDWEEQMVDGDVELLDGEKCT